MTPDAGEPTLPYVDEIADVPVAIGRYRLLEMAGVGGMGMVWAAWDPELERRVAIKLVRSSSADARARMLREGQVLARLSHPNIVPIFDVGELGDQIYLVMEWIRGETLGAYGREARELRAVLDAYRQAGEGLARAHDAGVIHRDFKPDNAIRGEDGRVRVLDFGIAHDSSSPGATSGGGTPKYMAPEHAATTAADQYAFCVSLDEALDAIGGAPRWIAAIVTRGSDPDPARRFESMRELLRALARDPARRWRRVAIGVAAIGAAVAAFAIGSARSSAPAIEPCSGAANEIAGDWNPTARDRMTKHLGALGTIGGVQAEPLGKELDGYAATWIDEHRRACLAQARTELTPALYEERLGCLTRLRLQLAATGELMTGVDADGLAPALTAAYALPDPRGCRDTSGLVAPPPAAVADRVRAVVPQIERALVRAAAKRSDAIELAKAATRTARATTYQPLIARALLVEGRAVTVDGTDARATFDEAMRLALAASDDVTAVEAYARWIFELARQGDTAIDNWPVMDVLAQRNGRATRFARALMYNNRAVAKMAEDKPGARAMLVEAKAIAGDHPELELVAIEKNLAGLETDPDACAARLRGALTRLQAALGPAHPDVLLTRIPLALLTRDRKAARAEVDEVCRGLERWGHGSAMDMLECAFEAAWLADEDGDRSAAMSLMTRVAGGSADNERVIVAKAYVGLAGDAPARAAAISMLEAFVAHPEPSGWWRGVAADALVLLARADPALWPRAVAMVESVDLPYYARRVARSRAELAERLAATRREDARGYAEQALAWYRGAPGDETLAKRLEAITAPVAR